jgi:hypothetical protein
VNTYVSKKIYETIPSLETFLNADLFSWKDRVPIDLSKLASDRLDALEKMMEENRSVRGTGVIRKDIRAWRRASKGDYSARPRSVEQFAAFLTELLRDVPGHRVYKRDEDRDAWLPFYVDRVQYNPPERGYGGGSPSSPTCTATFVYEEFGAVRSTTKSWHAADCVHRPLLEALARMGLHLETDELRAQYLEERERCLELTPKVGLQVLATGIGTDDLDGNDAKERWSWRQRNSIRLDHRGEPARCAIDVYRETDEKDREREVHLNLWFWERKTTAIGDWDDDEISEDEEEEPEEPEIPMHPTMAVFDFKRHLRFRVHVNCLEVYEYDEELAEKLILPEETLDLVNMLVGSEGQFKDIVGGKGGGAVVLCAGPPGVGKTLTAEVYAETMRRPLYSVQCSQLGTDPEALEASLMRIFDRAQRWNAILLLDEADVYVAKRGDDLEQNAIVGVFLRVLEYYDGALFMTTNRSESVDDAIASRCTARIDYDIPTREDQARIWRVIADVSGTAISDELIEVAVERHSNLSGRDIKNLVKLASMVSASREEPIGIGTIEFVKRFKPTQDAVAPRARRRGK